MEILTVWFDVMPIVLTYLVAHIVAGRRGPVDTNKAEVVNEHAPWMT